MSVHPEHIREVNAPAATLHAVERNPQGSPALLFLHGYLDHCRGFEWLIAALPSAWRTIALDFRGHGRSGHVPGGLYHLTDYLADVELTLDACGVDRVHLVGHSLGGTVALLYAAGRPDRVASLTAIESLGPPGAGRDRTVERLRQYVRDLHKPPLKRVYPSVETAAARLRHNNPSLSEAAALQLARHGTHPVEGGVQFTFDPAHRRRFGVALEEPQTLAFLRAVACPVLVIAGSRGFSFDEERMRARLGALRAREPVRIDGGHHVHLDSPQEVARVLASFVSAQL
jgi:pimeloyl-ACP methyl ester carboxylesterase